MSVHLPPFTVTRQTVVGQALKYMMTTQCFSTSAALFVNKKRMMKLVKKTKKKFYIHGNTAPQLGFNLGGTTVSKPSKGHISRLHIINAVLYKNILDVVQSNMVSEELEAVNVEILRVSMAADFSVCRVFWQATGSIDEDTEIQDTLNKHASAVRHKLTQLRVIGFLPKIVFVKDKGAANVAEVEKLLASIHLPSDEGVEGTMATEDGTMEFITKSSKPERELDLDLFGLNHQDLNRQIMQFKKKELNALPLSGEIRNYKEFKLKKTKRKSVDSVVNYEFEDDSESESDTEQWEDDFSDYEDTANPKER
ncbi:putative ribosome-binding factor A, mitochondrial [Ptychodera flava]|uniref:putative ribosome-binding factor A, mitochondrial n=1 Tax=Ptychodera flava TaxID=63121 RepID=UPI00396AAB54